MGQKDNFINADDSSDEEHEQHSPLYGDFQMGNKNIQQISGKQARLDQMVKVSSNFNINNLQKVRKVDK